MSQRASLKFLRIFLTFLFLSHFYGCTLLTSHPPSMTHPTAEDIRFYRELDKAVRAAGVRNAASVPVPGFPFLRADRFLVGLKKKLSTDSSRNLWLEKLYRLNLESRSNEINHLPEKNFLDLTDRLHLPRERESLLEKLRLDSEKSFRQAKAQNQFFDSVAQKIFFPSDYNTFLRIVGLYPLFAIPTLWGERQAHDLFRRWQTTPAEKLKVYGRLTAYALPGDKKVSTDDVISFFDPSRRNALDFPELTATETERLAAAFAPIIEQDITTAADRIGEIRWQAGHVHVDTQQPAVYYYLSQAFIKGKPVLQMNYSVWYAARSGPQAPWIERGTLDGFTMRITFDPDGQPLLLDVMNNCGCYHFFVPRQKKILRVKSRSADDPFVASWLPENFPQHSLRLRVNAGWHQVQHIDADAMPFETTSYRLLPYKILESLPHPDGRLKSVFNSHGIMKDSHRIEPLFFFPAGIPKVGYMRQRERHPIKLIGQEYFEDPEILDRSFEFK